MNGNELEREIKTIQNMLQELLCRTKATHYGSPNKKDCIEDFRPTPEPTKDLKWDDTTKMDDMKKESDLPYPTCILGVE